MLDLLAKHHPSLAYHFRCCVEWLGFVWPAYESADDGFAAIGMFRGGRPTSLY